MKILTVLSSGFEEGGVENGIVLWKPLFQKKGHIEKILASDTRPDLKHFNDYYFKNIDASLLGKYVYRSFNPYSYASMKKILKDFKPDVVALHTMSQLSPSILFLLKNYPTVLFIHGPEAFTKALLPWYMTASDFKHGEYDTSDFTFLGTLRYFYHRYITGFVYFLGLRNVDTVITLSRYMHRLMSGEGMKNIYVPNGAVLLDYRPLQQETTTHTLMYAGRLEQFKGVDFLLKSMRSIIEHFPDTHLFIAGNGSEKGKLEALTKELGITANVTFTGHLGHAELDDLYRRCTIVVIPSTWPEAFGKIGIEAMSVGRPVIATDVGGISDWLVNGETGYLVPPKDSQAISCAVLDLFSDKAKLIDMSHKARQQSLKFGLDACVDRVEQVYEDVINANKQGISKRTESI